MIDFGNYEVFIFDCDGVILDSNELKSKFSCHFESKDSIGKRYRRQDAIGTPICITIDHETLVENSVTVRDRDTMQQQRVTLDNLSRLIKEKLDI